MLYNLAELRYQGNVLSAADKVLSDFRKNLLTYGSLERPPIIGLTSLKRMKQNMDSGSIEMESELIHKNHLNSLNLLKTNELSVVSAVSDEDIESLDVGRGNYDGW